MERPVQLLERNGLDPVICIAIASAAMLKAVRSNEFLRLLLRSRR